MKERRDKTPQQALAALMRLCSRAERSSGDARRLMRRWGLSDDDGRQVLSRLTAEGFIDDRRYAGMYVRDKMRLAGWGPYKIAAALKAKGVSAEIVSEALTAGDVETSVGRLGELLRRKAASVKGCTPYELRGKLMRFGLSKGFDYGTVTEAVEKIVCGDD